MEDKEEILDKSGDESPEPASPEQDKQPGKLLWEARTKRNLSLEQVADDLCLTPQQVEAMEKDDYSYLPGATYARGYLRNYARLLGIPGDQVVSTADIPTTTVHSTASKPRKAVVVEESRRSMSVGFLSLVIVVILLGLIYSWWQSRETPELAVTVTESDENKMENTEAAPDEIMPASTEEQSVTAEENAEPAIVASEEVIAPEDSETSEASDAPIQTESELAAEPESVAIVSVSSEDGTDVALAFDADSWVEIKDASGNSLVRRTLSAGQTKVFKGEPPFNVFLGYAKGVKVNYRANDFDVSPHIRGAIARFTLK